MTTLRFMGIGDPEPSRARVYGADHDSIQDQRRREMLDALASDAGWVELDSPSHMAAIAALRERGWVPTDGELVPNPNGPGRVKVWRLTEMGRREWEARRRG